MGAAHSTTRKHKPVSSREPSKPVASNHANRRYSIRNTTSRRPIANEAKARTMEPPPPKSAKRTVKTANTRKPPKTTA